MSFHCRVLGCKYSADCGEAIAKHISKKHLHRAISAKTLLEAICKKWIIFETLTSYRCELCGSFNVPTGEYGASRKFFNHVANEVKLNKPDQDDIKLKELFLEMTPTEFINVISTKFYDYYLQNPHLFQH